VNGASAAKQYMFKKAMQVSHRRRLHLDKGEEVGSLTAAQHKFFDQLVLSKIRDTFGGNLKVHENFLRLQHCISDIMMMQLLLLAS
jgi:long-subunit acyl-CoA synthetase (AMP-forming)